MSEQPRSPNRRLEGMLRQWGAEEAARQQGPSRPLRTAGRTGRAVWTVMRWSAVAATVLILSSVVVMVLGPWLSHIGRRPAVATTGPTRPGQIRDLQDQLAAARSALAEAKTQLARTQPGLDGAAAQLSSVRKELEVAKSLLALEISKQRLAEAKSADLDKQLADQAKAIEEAKQQVVAAGEALKQKDALLKGLKDDLDRRKQFDELVSSELKKFRTRHSDILARLTVANSELSRLSKMHEQALAGRREVENDLAKMKAEHARILANVQRLYLSAAAAEEQGWAARRLAARQNRLLARCASLRPTVRGASPGRLVDRLEALLTRLELLDTDNPGAVRSFAAQAGAANWAGQIDGVLSAGTQPPAVQAWLLEARLLLAGGRGAG